MVMEKEIESILASLHMEDLQPSEETMAMIEQLKRGEITTAEAIKAGKMKYMALGRGERISLEEGLQWHRLNKEQ